MKQTARFISHWWPSALVTAVIIYATWVPKPIDPADIPPIPHIDKLIHAVMMGGLLGALLFDWRRADRSRRLGLRTVIVFASAVAAFSVVDEIVQGLLPIGRPSDPLDLLADWAGVALSAWLSPPAVRACLRD